MRPTTRYAAYQLIYIPRYIAVNSLIRPAYVEGYKSTPIRTTGPHLIVVGVSQSAQSRFFNNQSTKLPTGRAYYYVYQLPADYDSNKAVTPLLAHGFPDLWCVFPFLSMDPCSSYPLVVGVTWKHQVDFWDESDYRVVALDVLGYGRTDEPDEPGSTRPRGIPMISLPFSATLVPPKSYVSPTNC